MLYFVSDTVYVKLQYVYLVCSGVCSIIGRGVRGLFGGGGSGGQAGIRADVPTGVCVCMLYVGGWGVHGLADGGVWFLHIGSMSGA